MEERDNQPVSYPIQDTHLQCLAADKAAQSRVSMASIIGDMETRRLILGETAEASQICAIFDNEQVLGVLGFTVNGGDFAQTSLPRFLKHYGSISGFLRFLAYNFIKRLYFGPQLYVAAFWVDPDRRGGGFGQKLLAELREIAIERDMEIWTDVKHGNERAYRFYEKNGFKPQDRFYITSLLPRIMGYRRVYFDPNQ